MLFFPRRAFATILVGLAATGAVASRPDPSKYEFQLVEQRVTLGSGARVTVRLVNKATGKPVPDAVIFISRLDMSPDGMGDMTAPLEPVNDTLPGYYVFETDLLMEGAWALTLAGKVPGEPTAIQGKLRLEAMP